MTWSHTTYFSPPEAESSPQAQLLPDTIHLDKVLAHMIGQNISLAASVQRLAEQNATLLEQAASTERVLATTLDTTRRLADRLERTEAKINRVMTAMKAVDEIDVLAVTELLRELQRRK